MTIIRAENKLKPNGKFALGLLVASVMKRNSGSQNAEGGALFWGIDKQDGSWGGGAGEVGSRGRRTDTENISQEAATQGRCERKGMESRVRKGGRRDWG